MAGLTCGCNPTADEYDEYSKYTLSTTSSVSSGSSSAAESEVLNTPYSRATPLFREIEKDNWEGILMFLQSGKWSQSIFSSSTEHMRSPGPAMQAKTWVTSYDANGQPEWSQLPLHAAISYAAPFVVIQKLVELYPRAVQCTDNEGMLPIHLAYGFGAADNILALLLEPFPSSVNEKGLGGRYPYECCELGPNKIRGKVYEIVSQQIKTRVEREIEADWKKFATVAQESVGLKKKQDLTEKTLHQFLLELLKERKELYERKNINKDPSEEKSARTAKSTRNSIKPSAVVKPNKPANAKEQESSPKRVPSRRGSTWAGGKKYNI